MTAENNRAEEARAMERIATATRQVQAAFLRLQKKSTFCPKATAVPARWRWDAALQELEDA